MNPKRILNIPQAIVVGTRPDRNQWYENCMASLKTPYPIITVDVEGYEMGKIKWVIENTDIKEFVFLQDSIEIKDNTIFYECFSRPEAVSIYSYPKPFGCYFGKYNSEILRNLNLPDVESKVEAVDWEGSLESVYTTYLSTLPDHPLVHLKTSPHRMDEKLAHSDIFIEKFGKKVMVVENQYFIKYLSCWSREMAEEWKE